MDGVLAHANCLFIMTLWSLFKFVLPPIGSQLETLDSPAQFAAVFALIWARTSSLYGTMKSPIRSSAGRSAAWVRAAS